MYDMAMTVTKLATFKLPTADYERLEALAKRDDRTVSYILRLAVQSFLNENDEEQAA